MNLIIDIGNTATKVGIFSDKEMVDYAVFNEPSQETIATFAQPYSFIQSAILCSVKKNTKELEEYLKKQYSFILLNATTPIPIRNTYLNPETLGKDRLAAAVGANALFPNQNVLVMDAGTCITYDFVNAKNEYLGGSISPGIMMRYKALHTFTDNLPSIELIQETDLIGTNTGSSISSGVINGIHMEVEGIIKRYAKTFNPLKVVLTGGDMLSFEKNVFNRKSTINKIELKNVAIFAEPYLVLKGLNTILLYK